MSRVRAPSVTPSENGLTEVRPFFTFRKGRMSQTLESPAIEQSTRVESPWITIVWNDPVNLQSYVTWVFRSYFAISTAEAQRLMLLVHNEGRAVVATGGREEMERHVEAMHDFGLWATVTRSET